MRCASPETHLNTAFDMDTASSTCVAAAAGPVSASTLSIISFASEIDDRFLMSNVDVINQLELLASFGEGPIRFGPISRQATVRESLAHCKIPAVTERFIRLKLACENAGLDEHYSDEQIFRVASYKDFSVNKSLFLLKRMDPKYLQTTARQIEDQLRTQTLFPLPRLLRSDRINSFFYMRPSRYDPKVTPTRTIIANLIYVMDSLWERTRDHTHKIGFIANMNNWTMHHFAVDYCFQFMQALQGRSAPVNVDLFLIVNPPSWFGRIWKIMKPMLSPTFRKKVYMIPEEKLSNFLNPDFAQYLPDEFRCGHANVPALVEDFITFRKYVEESSLDHASHALNRTAPVWSATIPKRRDSTGETASGRPRRFFLRRSKTKSSSHPVDDGSGSNSECCSQTSHEDRNDLDAIPLSSWSRMRNPWDEDDEEKSVASDGSDRSDRSIGLLE